MTIWTIYNHGTGGSSLKSADKGEIINLFGNNDPRQLFRGKIITEGVGSIGDPHKLAREYSRTGDGEYWVESTQGSAWKTSQIGKQLSGGGVKENVDNTVEFIRALNLNGQIPTGINMIGWSRGAVTCTRIAYKLFQSKDAHLSQIPINIFAVDPVAGAGHSDEIDARTITPNVQNYFATLAMGETRTFFHPIAGQRLTIQDPNVTRSWVLPVPGHHSNTAKNNNNIGKLVFNLAYRFLDAAGTPVPAMRLCKLDDAEAWKLYEELMVGARKVSKTGFASQTFMGVVPYKRGNEGRAHGGGEDFFPNLHARLLMSQVFPLTYDAYFGGANAGQRHTPAWEARWRSFITMEQHRNAMSAGMIAKLNDMPQTINRVTPIPTGVWNVANGMRLIG